MVRRSCERVTTSTLKVGMMSTMSQSERYAIALGEEVVFELMQNLWQWPPRGDQSLTLWLESPTDPYMSVTFAPNSSEIDPIMKVVVVSGKTSNGSVVHAWIYPTRDEASFVLITHARE